MSAPILVQHFLKNLAAFEQGEAMTDRVFSVNAVK